MFNPLRTAALAALAFLTTANAQPGPSVEALKARLREKNAPIRSQALAGLAKLGPDAATATEAVEELLKSEAIEERLAASTVLIRLDPKRYDTDIRAVRDALRAKDSRTRTAALSALRLLGPAAKQEYGAVVAALFTPCEGSGANSTRPFAGFVDHSVLRAFGDAAGPPPKDAVPTLASAMADADPIARRVADSLLWQAVQAGNADPAAFLPLVTHKESYARAAGMRLLARCERVPASVVAAVAAALADSEARPYAVEILVRSAPHSVAHLPAMQKGIDDALERAWLAARVDPAAHGDAVAKLIAERLDDLRKRGQVGGVEMQRLARMVEALGPFAKSAAPALVRSFGESTSGALCAIGPAAVPELRAVLRDPRRADLHHDVVRCLREFGSEAGDAVPELVALLEAGVKPAKLAGLFETSPEDDLLVTLNAIGPAAARPEVLKVLKRRLREGDSLARIMIAGTVGKLGPKAKELAPTLADVISKAGQTEGMEFAELFYLSGLIGIDPTHPAVKDTLGRRGKDKSDVPPVPALLERTATFSGGQQKCDHATVDAIALVLKKQPELQESARKWVAECLRKAPQSGAGDPYPVCVPAALAQLNPADLPLALKAFEKALDAGDPQPLAVIHRLGVAAKPIAPAVKRFVDKQPPGLACRGEGYDPANKPVERGGGCMFCAPVRQEVALGLVTPPEPFLPSPLKAPVYTSAALRVLAAETLAAISSAK